MDQALSAYLRQPAWHSSDAALEALPVSLAHFALERLARGVARKGVHDHDRFHPLVFRGDALVDPLLQFLRPDARARAQDHGSERRLAPLVVRNTEDRNLSHRRVARRDLLDVLWIDLHTAGIDHVLLAVDQIKVSVLVDVAQVAAPDP